ncbi:MAG TPA: YidC/Oxa1 family membrane protein insertase [Solirubrobacteraceae bacterium]|jgi:YidC/Oxa1 family membrane protein insertase
MLLTANILQPLINVFEVVLKFFHNNVGVGWGLSIVLLTIVIRAALVPLTVKQFRSMQALQAHQPELKALQAKYKDDKQRLNQEIMKFYKENNVNPLGSCLPLVLQFPVFISLYYLLRRDLRGNICPQVQPGAHMVNGHWIVNSAHTVPCGLHNGAQFLFIGDLTNKATGIVLVVLMGLYIGSQLFSSMLMASPAMDKTQRRLMMLMPLVFVIFFISFPAGVILYWITTNLWTIGQQTVVKRFIGPPPTAVAVAGAAAGAPGGGGGTSATGGGGKPSAGGGGAGGVGRPAAPKKPSGGTGKAPADAKPATTGAKAAAAGLLRRGRLEPAPEASGGGSSRAGAPPPSPRKKKKRSGRRR